MADLRLCGEGCEEWLDYMDCCPNCGHQMLLHEEDQALCEGGEA